MNGLRIWLVVGALLAGALFVACGGGGDDKDKAGEEPSATATSESEGTNGDGGATGDVSEELQSLAGEWGKKSVKVAYDFTTTTAGQSSTGAMTLYWKPPDSWRMDFDSEGTTGILISSGGKSYLCSESDGGGQCLESPAGQAAPFPFLSAFTDPGALQDLVGEAITGVDVERSERTIAGQAARCFSISGAAAGGSAEYCFSEDGIMLLLRSGASGSEFVLEATSVEGEVTEADLQPPYPIMEIPGVP